MSHATHFLSRLDRLDDSQVAFAMSLYRNVPLVRRLVETAAPPGDGRVAIAVAAQAGGPHVVVERDGAFITCLGAGMTHGLPVISRAAVDRLAHDHAELRRALALREELRRDDRWVARILQLDTGPRVSREVARDVIGWAPVLGRSCFELFNDDVRDFAVSWARLRNKTGLRDKHLPDARRVWLTAWAMGHLAGPSAPAVRPVWDGRHPDDPPCLRTLFAAGGIHTRLAASVLRGVWATAFHADSAMDDLERAWREADDLTQVFAAAYGLAAIALRRPSLRARARAILEGVPGTVTEPDAEDHAFYGALRAAVDRPEEALARHLERARTALGKTLGPVDDLDATTILASELLDGAILETADDYRRLADAIPFVAAAEWEDLYVPEAVLARLPPIDLDAGTRRYLDERLRVTAEQRARDAAPPAPKVGRNDPCHCGSGRKFKKCHGA